MDLHSPTTPRFSVGGELAAFITSCGILQKAWEEICSVSKSNVDYFLEENEGVAYVTFRSFSTEDFNVTGSGEYDITNEKIFYACLKGDAEKPALVHEGALNRFRRILERSDFQKKMKDLKAQTIIFVGHSMGGAVATMATLYYLQKRVRGKSYFCITFGSPLVGNAILGKAIGVQDWIGKFCYVVSNYDIVPRMLLAPFDSIFEHLNTINPHWGSGMGTDSVAVTHPSITSLLEKVLQCTSNIENNYSGLESSLTSPYRPFGTYMFCSTQGAACIDDPEAVLKMLHFTLQGIPFDQLAGTCASDHTGYGKMLGVVTDALLNATPIANFATDSFEMGIALELEAMAVEAQKNPHASNALRKAGEKKNEQDKNIEKLNEELSIMQSHMAEVEWYKARCCKKGSGYYDSFKEQEAQDQHVNLARDKLERFWKEEIVEKEEKHILPSDFSTRNKWINAGTAYRRLVEPLDIAHYYRTRKDTKSYLSDEGRSHHHRVLEKWMKEKDQTRTATEKEQTRGAREKKPRTKFASLTEDSCFWADLEDASQALSSLLQQNDLHENMNALVQENREFENSIWNMIRDKSISVEVFLKGSSFMSWWKEYSNFMSWWQQQHPESKPSSDLSSFMQNEQWR